MSAEYIDIAKTMLQVQNLPTSLEQRLLRVNQLIQNTGGASVVGQGGLNSRQVIAMIIAEWEARPSAKHRSPTTHPRNNGS